MTSNSPEIIRAAAIAFAKQMKLTLVQLHGEQDGAKFFAEIDTLNAAEQDKNVCHSHDHCDANVVMEWALAALLEMSIERFEEGVFGEDEREANRLQSLFNRAWDLTKAEGFQNLAA